MPKKSAKKSTSTKNSSKSSRPYPIEHTSLAGLETYLAEAGEMIVKCQQLVAVLQGEAGEVQTPMGKGTKPARDVEVKDSYTEEELTLLSRAKLDPIAKAFGVKNTQGLTASDLRTAILDALGGPSKKSKKTSKKSGKKKSKKGSGLRLKL